MACALLQAMGTQGPPRQPLAPEAHEYASAAWTMSALSVRRPKHNYMGVYA